MSLLINCRLLSTRGHRINFKTTTTLLLLLTPPPLPYYYYNFTTPTYYLPLFTPYYYNFTAPTYYLPPTPYPPLPPLPLLFTIYPLPYPFSPTLFNILCVRIEDLLSCVWELIYSSGNMQQK